MFAPSRRWREPADNSNNLADLQCLQKLLGFGRLAADGAANDQEPQLRWS
jgi:hypothetical protein